MSEQKLGMKMRDRITGFEGIAVTQVFYLYGCMQFGLSPKVDDKGEPRDCQFFDHQRLEVLADEPAIPITEQPNGGINRDAPRLR